MALGAVTAAIAATLLFGWFWVGLGDIVTNHAVLNSLPLPPGVQRVLYDPHPYNEGDGVLIPTPSDRWALLTMYQAPPETTRDDILDFYISRLSPEWNWCLRRFSTVHATGVQTVEIGGASFTKGSALVAIDAYGLEGGSQRTYDIYVEHQRRYDPCLDEGLN